MTRQLPDLAIALSRQGISLNQRTAAGGWREVSVVPLDDPELSAHLDAFRAEAEGAGTEVLVWIPRDQVQLVDVSGSIKDQAAIRAAAIAAHPDAAGQSPDDFAFSLGEPDDANCRPVAITPRAILREAEDFVRKIGFEPVAYELQTPLEDFATSPRFTLAPNETPGPEYVSLFLLGCFVLGLVLIAFSWQWRNSAHLGDDISIAATLDTLPAQEGSGSLVIADWSAERTRIIPPETLAGHNTISSAAFSPPEIPPPTRIFGLPGAWSETAPLPTSDQTQFAVSALAPVRIDDLSQTARRARSLLPFGAAIQSDIRQLRDPALVAPTITLPSGGPAFAMPALSPLVTHSNASLPIAQMSFQIPPAPQLFDLSRLTNIDKRTPGIAPLTPIARTRVARLPAPSQAYPRELLAADIAFGTPQPVRPFAGETAANSRLPASLTLIARPIAAERPAATMPNEAVVGGAAQIAAVPPPAATEPANDADAVILNLASLPVLRPVPPETEVLTDALVTNAIAEAEAEAEALPNIPSDIALSSQSAPRMRLAVAEGDVPEVAARLDTQSPTLITLNHASPPFARPAGFAERVARLQTVEPDTDEPALAAPVLGPQMPTSANVQEAATIENMLPMHEMTLIAVFGTSGNRYALLRLSNGKIVRAKTGDRFSGGYVIAAIGSNAIRIRRDGRDTVLVIPE